MKLIQWMPILMISILAGTVIGCVAPGEPEELDLEPSGEAMISSGSEVPEAGALESLAKAPDDDAALVGCRWAYAQASSFDALRFVWYTPTMSSSSGCGHLYVQNYTSGCVSARIRYYPSSGGSFTSNYLQVCNGGWAPFSTNLLAGTVFRIESPTPNAQFVLDF